MPRRIFKSRAYQFAQEPESLVTITRSGRRGDNSQVTRCGLIGLASAWRAPRASSTIRRDYRRCPSAICRRAFHHQVPARLGTKEPDRASDPWQIVRQRRLAEQRLGGAGLQPVGDRDHFIGGVERAGADQNGAIKRTKHAIDAVARITEHFFDAPRMEPLDKKIATVWEIVKTSTEPAFEFRPCGCKNDFGTARPGRKFRQALARATMSRSSRMTTQ